MRNSLGERYLLRGLFGIVFVGIIGSIGTPHGSGSVAHAQTATSPPLSPDDVSWLFPAPTGPDDFSNLISMRDLVANREDPAKREAVWPDLAFQQFLQNAASAAAQVEGAQRIGLPQEAQSMGNWFVAGVRIDAGAPGLSTDIQVNSDGHQRSGSLCNR
jgi:hypothetical protein